MMKNKIVILSLLCAITCNAQIFSMNKKDSNMDMHNTINYKTEINMENNKNINEIDENNKQNKISYSQIINNNKLLNFDDPNNNKNNNLNNENIGNNNNNMMNKNNDNNNNNMINKNISNNNNNMDILNKNNNNLNNDVNNKNNIEKMNDKINPQTQIIHKNPNQENNNINDINNILNPKAFMPIESNLIDKELLKNIKEEIHKKYNNNNKNVNVINENKNTFNSDGIYDKYNEKLPYMLSQSEINKVPNPKKRYQLQTLYSLVKLTFDMIINQSKSFSNYFIKLFQYNISDMVLTNIIKFCLYELLQVTLQANKPRSKYKNYKDIYQLFQIMCNNDQGNAYLNDIIHNNMYSAFASLVVKKKAETLNTQNSYGYKSYIQKKIIQPICEAIKNPYRRRVINNILRDYYLHDRPEYINMENYQDYTFILRGIQEDMYKVVEKEYDNNLLVSELSFYTFSQLLYECRESYYPDDKDVFIFFANLINGGYVTNPEIIKDINEELAGGHHITVSHPQAWYVVYNVPVS